jgi:hypothetical protein
MQCPYCGETIKDSAILCKHCHQVLMNLDRPLVEHHQQLLAKVTELQSELARVKAAATRQQLVGGNDFKPVPPASTLWFWLSYSSRFVLLPVSALLIAHYLIVIGFDLKVIVLRGVSILIPLLFGFAQTRGWTTSAIFVGFVGIVIGTTAVIGMSAVMHLVYGYPIVPSTTRDWQEEFEFALSMALATIAGYSLGMIIPSTAVQSQSESFESKGSGGKIFADHIDLVERLIRVLTMIFAAIGSVYVGLRGILG